MPDGDPDEQDRAFLRHVGVVPRNRKPLSVWLVQALCLVFGVFTISFAFRMEGPTALAIGALGLVYLAVIVGAQRRQGWARWTIVAILTLGAGGSTLELLEPHSEDTATYPGHVPVAPNERSGAAVGQVTVIILVLLLGLRIGFGEPAKLYFAKPPSKPE